MRSPILYLAAGLLLAACAPAPERSVTPRATLTVAIDADHRATAPDSMAAGWTRLAYTTPRADGDGHNMVALQLPGGMTPEQLVAMLAAGVQPTGVVACLILDGTDRSHAARGEWHTVRVYAPAVAADTGAVPANAIAVDMVDFAYPGGAERPAGRRTLAVRNTGQEDHLAIVIRLRDGRTLANWMGAEGADSVGTFVAGAARVSAGHTEYLTTTLTPGTYILVCLVHDPQTGRQHVELGMMREIHVVVGRQ